MSDVKNLIIKKPNFRKKLFLKNFRKKPNFPRNQCQTYKT